MVVYAHVLGQPILLTTMAIPSIAVTVYLATQIAAHWRWSNFQSSAVAASVTSLFHKRKTSDILPPAQLALLNHKEPEVVVQGMAHKGIQGGNWRVGYISILNDELFFTYSKAFGPRLWRLGIEQVRASLPSLPFAIRRA